MDIPDRQGHWVFQPDAVLTCAGVGGLFGASLVLWDFLGIDFIYLPGVKAPITIGWWVVPLSILAVLLEGRS